MESSGASCPSLGVGIVLPALRLLQLRCPRTQKPFSRLLPLTISPGPGECGRGGTSHGEQSAVLSCHIDGSWISPEGGSGDTKTSNPNRALQRGAPPTAPPGGPARSPGTPPPPPPPPGSRGSRGARAPTLERPGGHGPEPPLPHARSDRPSPRRPATDTRRSSRSRSTRPIHPAASGYGFLPTTRPPGPPHDRGVPGLTDRSCARRARLPKPPGSPSPASAAGSRPQPGEGGERAESERARARGAGRGGRTWRAEVASGGRAGGECPGERPGLGARGGPAAGVPDPPRAHPSPGSQVPLQGVPPQPPPPRRRGDGAPGPAAPALRPPSTIWKSTASQSDTSKIPRPGRPPALPSARAAFLPRRLRAGERIPPSHRPGRRGSGDAPHLLTKPPPLFFPLSPTPGLRDVGVGPGRAGQPGSPKPGSPGDPSELRALRHSGRQVFPELPGALPGARSALGRTRRPAHRIAGRVPSPTPRSRTPHLFPGTNWGVGRGSRRPHSGSPTPSRPAARRIPAAACAAPARAALLRLLLTNKYHYVMMPSCFPPVFVKHGVVPEAQADSSCRACADSMKKECESLRSPYQKPGVVINTSDKENSRDGVFHSKTLMSHGVWTKNKQVRERTGEVVVSAMEVKTELRGKGGMMERKAGKA
uniref:basic proline-rich protein-like n=1 Tax=Jaculus jaculus TaxID=51337 RepID=UPI001E1B45B9|nr:basic proline-rich protein-like [Jaculus jaculus]